MIYINEFTGERFSSAAECQKSEQEWLVAKKKAEEKARFDKAKREAEKKKKDEEEKAKKEKVKAAYKDALDATEKATAAIEAYIKVCEKEGYHVNSAFDFSPLMKLIFEI